MIQKQKRRPGGGGADLRGGDQHPNIKPAQARPLVDGVAGYRALCLISNFGVRPELATMLAALAFDGGAR